MIPEDASCGGLSLWPSHKARVESIYNDAEDCGVRRQDEYKDYHQRDRHITPAKAGTGWDCERGLVPGNQQPGFWVSLKVMRVPVKQSGMCSTR
jgi:hypothetical protein